MSSSTTNEFLLEAIKLAVEQNKTTELEALLDDWKSADLDPLQPALFAALKQGHIDAIELLLSRG